MSITLGMETRVWGKGHKASVNSQAVDASLIEYWNNIADTLVECYLSKR